MRTLRPGDSGDAVRHLQSHLVVEGHDIAVDGAFGPRTEAAVIAFQIANDLIADGIVGPKTWDELGEGPADSVWQDSAAETRLPWRRVDADVVAGYDGYNRLYLRADVALALEKVRAELHAVGAVLTTSGGRRRLDAQVSATRSATSLHYVGRAVDLAVSSALADPQRDPYVVTSEPDGYWRVWAACAPEHGRALTLQGWMHREQAALEVTGHFVDLTAIMSHHGFARIRRRRSYPRNLMAAEWWHFQYERGLVAGVTTFGSELLRVYSLEELEDTPPWRYRDAVWGEDWH